MTPDSTIHTIIMSYGVALTLTLYHSEGWWEAPQRVEESSSQVAVSSIREFIMIAELADSIHCARLLP